MMMKTTIEAGRCRAACLALLALVGLAGCATVPAPTPEEAVLARAQERLDYVLAEDYAAAYEYLSPGYRSGVSLTSYQRELLTRPVRWVSAEAVESDCSEDVCNVRIAIEFEVYGAVPGMSRFKSPGGFQERWLRIDGQWYLVPKS